MPRVRVVPHTHWDREWYLSFERFRDKLVVTLDSVLELLRSDPGWKHFHLDGQTAMIDDYLSIRPEREEEIRELVRSGRLSCGPWVTLVDEFLVSGESVIRNLEDGISRAEELGGATMFGYLPDQFGHIGQMPQLLRSMGIERALTWRGVPGIVESTTFRWKAPDGSAVDVCYLPYGYGQGGKAPDDPARFHDRIVSEIDSLRSFTAPGETVLLTVGDDHERPLLRLPELIEKASTGDLEIGIGSLAEHAGGMRAPEVTVSGELRSAARANLLPNTYSARIDQKVARARAEHAIERYAEPLGSLVPGFTWPSESLAEAWSELHLNGAHDSVCGCSTDEVAEAVDRRTARAYDIATRVADEALTRLGAAVEDGGTLRFNPSTFERAGVPGMGWSVGPVSEVTADDARFLVDGDRLVIESPSDRITLGFEDEPDDGDLYTFCSGGPAEGPVSMEASERSAVVSFGSGSITLEIEPARDNDWLSVAIAVDNSAIDHRVRMLLDLPQEASATHAGSAFEIVERPRVGEGGISEPPSPNWPARGFVVAGGSGYLSEGVIEYELTEDNRLAVALLRCTGTISRPHRLETRAAPAGPDVATPGAQMLGVTHLRLGIFTTDPGRGVIEAWERFALPLLFAEVSGGGKLPRRGTLLDLDVPALSAVRRVDDVVEVRAWNPWPEDQEMRAGGKTATLGPHRIGTLRLDESL